MDSVSAPLADYFWIAGVESSAFDDVFGSQEAPSTQIEDAIAEDG